jgi:hypothetical protein
MHVDTNFLTQKSLDLRRLAVSFCYELNMNHPYTPLVLKNEAVKDDSAHVDIDIQQIRTATAAGSTTGDAPNSKSSEQSLVVDDAADLAPDKFDVLLQDITAKYLAHDLSSRFQVEYLSHLGRTRSERATKAQKSTEALLATISAS